MDAIFFTRHAPERTSGGAYATRAFLQAMASIFGNRLTAAGPTDLSTVRTPYPLRESITIPARSTFHKVAGILLRRYVERTTPYILENAEQIARHYRVAVLDGGVMGLAAAKLQSLGMKVVTIHHNVEVDYWRTAVSRSRSRLCLAALARIEGLAVRHSSLNLTLTIGDSARLQQLYSNCGSGPFETIGCFERCELRPPDPVRTDLHRTSTVILSTGSLTSMQTVDGVSWFLNNVWSKLREHQSTITYRIAGKQPPDSLFALADQHGAEVISNPPDMDDVLTGADLIVVPTRLGSGIKLRVMDGLRHGLPTVSHAVAARGYESFVSNPYFKVYDNADQCLQHIHALLDDVPLDYKKKKSIQSAYLDCFSFDSGVSRIRSALKRCDIHDE